MTREPQATTKTPTLRANGNPLFFNNSDKKVAPRLRIALALTAGFAQSRPAPQSKQHVAIAVHRPASRPGADWSLSLGVLRQKRSPEEAKSGIRGFGVLERIGNLQGFARAPSTLGQAVARGPRPPGSNYE